MKCLPSVVVIVKELLIVSVWVCRLETLWDQRTSRTLQEHWRERALEEYVGRKQKTCELIRPFPSDSFSQFSLAVMFLLDLESFRGQTPQ